MIDDEDDNELLGQINAANTANERAKRTGQLFRYEKQAVTKAAADNPELYAELQGMIRSGQSPNMDWLGEQLGLQLQVCGWATEVATLCRRFGKTPLCKQLNVMWTESNGEQNVGVVFNCRDWQRFLIVHTRDFPGAGCQLRLDETYDTGVPCPVILEPLVQFVTNLCHG